VLEDTTGAGALAWASTGDVTGPVSLTATALPRFADNTGKALSSSGVFVDASNSLNGVAIPVRVSKTYVDSSIAGLKCKSPVRVATTGG
jgi:hypothetical protein